MLQSWASKSYPIIGEHAHAVLNFMTQQVTIEILKYTLNFSFEYIKYFTVVASRFYEDDTVNFFLISNFD